MEGLVIYAIKEVCIRAAITPGYREGLNINQIGKIFDSVIRLNNRRWNRLTLGKSTVSDEMDRNRRFTGFMICCVGILKEWKNYNRIYFGYINFDEVSSKIENPYIRILNRITRPRCKGSYSNIFDYVKYFE